MGQMTGRMDGKDDRTDRHLKYFIVELGLTSEFFVGPC
jgi:hypothetical protein